MACYLQGDKTLNFVQAETSSNVQLYRKMKEKYPGMTNILVNLVQKNGKIEKPVCRFITAMLNHTKNVYKKCEKRNMEDYTSRKGGEIDSQIFPNFPIWRERAEYEAASMTEDKKSLNELCEKNFPRHASLTPGLMIMTCACPNKVVYGFSMMLSGESPQMIFDIIMSRFPPHYNPNIIYDNSCQTKEYGLNRETRRFMEIQITTDNFHEFNHTACSDSFKSSIYNTLDSCNSQACEQTNKALREIGKSCVFMNPKMFMTAVTLYLANQNLNK